MQPHLQALNDASGARRLGQRRLGTPLWSMTAAALLALSAAAGPAAAAADATRVDRSAIKAQFERDRADCLSGRSAQDQASCLKEAGAAYQEAMKGQADNGESAAQLKANALKRCEPLPAADRADCERRVQGEGSQSGSVATGGIYRELTTRTVGEPTLKVERVAPSDDAAR